MSLGGLFCGASGGRPPSLSGFFWGFSLFSALEVPRGDHTLKDSKQSVVHHEKAPTQELVELFGGTPAHSSVSTWSTALDTVTPWEEASAGVLVQHYATLTGRRGYCHLVGSSLSVLSGQLFPWCSAALGDSVFARFHMFITIHPLLRFSLQTSVPEVLLNFHIAYVKVGCGP